MKKLSVLILSAVLTISMASAAFAGQDAPDTGSDSSISVDLNELIGMFGGSFEQSSEDGDSSGLSGLLSDILNELKQELPGIISSVKEEIPEIVSSIKDSIPEIAGDLEDALGSDQELAPEDKESIQNALDQISGLIGGSSIAAGSDMISGVAGDAQNGGSDVIAGDGEDHKSLDDILGSISGIAGSSPADAQDPASAGSSAPVMTGGWTIDYDAESLLTEAEEEIFAKAENTLAGGFYAPVAVIAKQLVAGTNYAFLCLGSADDPGEGPSWYIIAVYEDLSGNVTTFSIEEIELDDIETLNTVFNPSFVGSWTPNLPEDPETLDSSILTDDAAKAFDEATAGYVGVGYTPIALLGTQVVAGLNYRFLCYGTLVTQEPVTSLYVLDVYQDLQGKCSITNADLFDLTEYIDYGEED